MKLETTHDYLVLAANILSLNVGMTVVFLLIMWLVLNLKRFTK